MEPRRIPAFWVAAAVLAGHAVWAGTLAFRTFALPIEAGGFFFGLLIGVPLLVVAAVLGTAALLTAFVPRLPWVLPAGLLVLVAAFDGYLIGGVGMKESLATSLVTVLVALAFLGEAVLTGRRRPPAGRPQPPHRPYPPYSPYQPYAPYPPYAGPPGGSPWAAPPQAWPTSQPPGPGEHPPGR